MTEGRVGANRKPVSDMGGVTKGNRAARGAAEVMMPVARSWGQIRHWVEVEKAQSSLNRRSSRGNRSNDWIRNGKAKLATDHSYSKDAIVAEEAGE